MVFHKNGGNGNKTCLGNKKIKPEWPGRNDVAKNSTRRKRRSSINGKLVANHMTDVMHKEQDQHNQRPDAVMMEMRKAITYEREVK